MLDLYKQKIEAHLIDLIPINSPFYPKLYEGGRYALLAPGKRIRPLLTISAAEMVQEGSIDMALAPACALELVHTYSLIHDDLPCMDDDDFRRGRPTLHRVYSEGHAVLVGDYLLTYAFEVISSAPRLSAEQKISLTQQLASAAGSEGMIGGQVMDIEDSPHVDHMHHLKTAALFSAALAFGGIVAHACSDTMNLLKQFGTQFGQLFQMVDDLLDGDHPRGENHAINAASSHFQSTLAILEKLPGNKSSLIELTHLVFSQCPLPI